MVSKGKLSLAWLMLVIMMLGANTQVQAQGEEVVDEHGSAIATLMEARDQLNRQAALITSEDELIKYQKFTDPAYNPMNALSTNGRKEFLDSLQFGPNGLASFQYDVLVRELRPVESYAVLELFGVQEIITSLHHEKEATDLDRMLNDAASIKFMLCDHASLDDQCGPYVRGRCLSTATCGGTGDSWCHPPSCP